LSCRQPEGAYPLSVFRTCLYWLIFVHGHVNDPSSRSTSQVYSVGRIWGCFGRVCEMLGTRRVNLLPQDDDEMVLVVITLITVLYLVASVEAVGRWDCIRGNVMFFPLANACVVCNAKKDRLSAWDNHTRPRPGESICLGRRSVASFAHRHSHSHSHPHRCTSFRIFFHISTLIIWVNQLAMLFDPSTSDHLKQWLTKTLEPMSVHPLLSHTFPVGSREPISLLRCDADPTALADYILALLKHNGPESDLRKELAAQLDEFLEKGATLVIVIPLSLLSEHLPRAQRALPSSTRSSPPFVQNPISHIARLLPPPHHYPPIMASRFHSMPLSHQAHQALLTVVGNVRQNTLRTSGHQRVRA
jgi:hypothetical protein